MKDQNTTTLLDQQEVASDASDEMLDYLREQYQSELEHKAYKSLAIASNAEENISRELLVKLLWLSVYDSAEAGGFLRQIVQNYSEQFAERLILTGNESVILSFLEKVSASRDSEEAAIDDLVIEISEDVRNF